MPNSVLALSMTADCMIKPSMLYADQYCWWLFLHSYILLFFNRSDHESPRQHPGSVLPLKGVSYHRWTRPPVCGLRRRGRRSRITTSLVWGRLGRWGASQRSIRRKRKRSNIVTKGFKHVAPFFIMLWSTNHWFQTTKCSSKMLSSGLSIIRCQTLPVKILKWD